jgi:hypothetical protein
MLTESPNFEKAPLPRRSGEPARDIPKQWESVNEKVAWLGTVRESLHDSLGCIAEVSNIGRIAKSVRDLNDDGTK